MVSYVDDGDDDDDGDSGEDDDDGEGNIDDGDDDDGVSELIQVNFIFIVSTFFRGFSGKGCKSGKTFFRDIGLKWNFGTFSPSNYDMIWLTVNV